MLVSRDILWFSTAITAGPPRSRARRSSPGAVQLLRDPLARCPFFGFRAPPSGFAASAGAGGQAAGVQEGMFLQQRRCWCARSSAARLHPVHPQQCCTGLFSSAPLLLLLRRTRNIKEKCFCDQQQQDGAGAHTEVAHVLVADPCTLQVVGPFPGEASRVNFPVSGGGTVPIGVRKTILYGNGWYEANIRDWTL